MRACRAKSFGTSAPVTSFTSSSASAVASQHQTCGKFVEKNSGPPAPAASATTRSSFDVVALHVELAVHALPPDSVGGSRKITS